MAAAALLQPGALVPVLFMIVDPAPGLGIELGRGDIQIAVLLDQITLLPLAADGVLDVFERGNIAPPQPAP